MDDWQKIKTSNDKVHGFTLIELLVAVAILGVLVTLAMPRYKAFVARSRQGEAKSNLGTIAKLQEAYWMYKIGVDGTGSFYTLTGKKYGGNNNNCKGDAVTDPGTNALGFRLTDCDKARYAYGLGAADNTAQGGKGHTGLTHQIYPDCPQAKEKDEWKITNTTFVLTNDPDIVNQCKG